MVMLTDSDLDYFNMEDFQRHGQLFKPASRQPCDSLSIQFKQICIEFLFITVHSMGINVNPDRKRFRYSDVDTGYVPRGIPNFNKSVLRNNRDLI